MSKPEEELVHVTYLGKYLNYSYVLKRNKNQLKPKTKYKIIKTKGIDKGETTRILKVNKAITNDYFSNFSKYNNIDASIRVGLHAELNEIEKAVVGRGGKTIAMVHINQGNGCECGCKDIAVDHDHGETFCPHCGLILDTSIASEFLETNQ